MGEQTMIKRMEIEIRPSMLALDHLNGIEDPIRVTDERGYPFLQYAAAHVTAAFEAGMEKARDIDGAEA